LLGGDFSQTLPVVTHGTKADILNTCLLSSPLWLTSSQISFDCKKICASAMSQMNKLMELSKGLLNNMEDNICIPDSLISPYLSALLLHTYPNISHTQTMDYFRDWCILAPCNWEANEINDFVLEQFLGHSYNLWAVDKAFDPDTEMVSEDPYPPELLHCITPSGFPLAWLKLKIGCPVIVLQNLHSAEGVCNGSRGIVTRISTRVVKVLLHNGTTCLIPRVKLICSDTQLPFHLHRLRFPLAVSFAITINKAQGQSFTMVGIDLRIPAFAHGQVYVVLSRGKSCKCVRCVLNESTTLFTKNIVYREAIF
jgi:hypothetical protein